MFESEQSGVEAIPAAQGPPRVLVFPNPCAREGICRANVNVSGPLDVSVFGPSGNLVKSLFSETSAVPGTHLLRWDTTDDGGRPVPAGMYFVRLRAGNWSGASRVMVIR